MIHITDFNGDIVDFISKSDGAVTEAEHMINVADKLETFDFTILTSRTEHLQKRNRIIIEDKDGQYREFVIYNISSDLNGYTRVQTNASALEDIKTAKPVPPHKLEKQTVKQALEFALADTGWDVSDDSEWGGTRTTSWTGWHDRISILKQLETTYKMRLSFHVEVGSNRITNRYVSLKKIEPMFNGEEIVYGDNLTELTRTVDFSDIATALMCLGPEDSETGKREIVEVKDDDAQAQFGLPYRYIWDIYEPETSDEKMTRQRLETLGRTALNKRKQSAISYDIKGVDLSASAGDMIRVKNEDFTPELYVDAEVVEVTTDLISGETDYKFGVIKEYTRAEVYAKFYAMLDTLRERLNNVVSNTDSIISERLESELASFERYIHKSNVPPLNPKEGDLWLKIGTTSEREQIQEEIDKLKEELKKLEALQTQDREEIEKRLKAKEEEIAQLKNDKDAKEQQIVLELERYKQLIIDFVADVKRARDNHVKQLRSDIERKNAEIERLNATIDEKIQKTIEDKRAEYDAQIKELEQQRTELITERDKRQKAIDDLEAQYKRFEDGYKTNVEKRKEANQKKIAEHKERANEYVKLIDKHRNEHVARLRKENADREAEIERLREIINRKTGGAVEERTKELEAELKEYEEQLSKFDENGTYWKPVEIVEEVREVEDFFDEVALKTYIKRDRKFTADDEYLIKFKQNKLENVELYQSSRFGLTNSFGYLDIEFNNFYLDTLKKAGENFEKTFKIPKHDKYIYSQFLILLADNIYNLELYEKVVDENLKRTLEQSIARTKQLLETVERDVADELNLEEIEQVEKLQSEIKSVLSQIEELLSWQLKTYTDTNNAIELDKREGYTRTHASITQLLKDIAILESKLDDGMTDEEKAKLREIQDSINQAKRYLTEFDFSNKESRILSDINSIKTKINTIERDTRQSLELSEYQRIENIKNEIANDNKKISELNTWRLNGYDNFSRALQLNEREKYITDNLNNIKAYQDTINELEKTKGKANVDEIKQAKKELEDIQNELVEYDRNNKYKSQIAVIEEQLKKLYKDLETASDQVIHITPILYVYKDGEWIKAGVDNVEEIGGMTKEQTLYENLKLRYQRNEISYANAYNRYVNLTEDKYYEYVELELQSQYKEAMTKLTSKFIELKNSFVAVNEEQPDTKMITDAIQLALEFEEELKAYEETYIKVRESYDEYIQQLQRQYTDEKWNEALQEIADSINGEIDGDGNIDITKALNERIDSLMHKIADSINGYYDGQNIIADIPNQKALEDLNQSIRAFVNGQVDALDGKLGKQINTVVNQAKDSFTAEVNTIDRKVSGLDSRLTGELKGIEQEVNTTNSILKVLENKINLKVDDIRVKQILNEELEPVKSQVQTNTSQFSVLSNRINSKVDSSIYETDKNNIVRDIQSNKSEITQTDRKIDSSVSSLNRQINETNNTLRSAQSKITQLENMINLEVDEEEVKRILNRELETIRTEVNRHNSRLNILSGQINSKVETTTYEADKNNIVRDIRSAKTEINQLSDKITNVVSVDEYRNGTSNLLIDSGPISSTTDYLIREYDMLEPFENNQTYTFQLKGSVTNSSYSYKQIAIARVYNGSNYFINYNITRNNRGIYELTFNTDSSFNWRADKLRVYNYPQTYGARANVDWAKLERGSIGTAWSPTPQDDSKIIERFESEIEQTKNSIRQKVGYQEINKSNETLEKVISELLVSTSGIRYTYDHNGLLSGFNLNRQYFKLNHNLIDINNGDVTITNGRTTIKQAVIENGHIKELSFDKLSGGTAKFGGKDYNGALEVLDNEDNPIMKLDYEQAVASELSVGTVRAETIESESVVGVMENSRVYEVNANLYSSLEVAELDGENSDSSGQEDDEKVNISTVERWNANSIQQAIDSLPRYLQGSVRINVRTQTEDDIVVISGFQGSGEIIIRYHVARNYNGFKISANTTRVDIHGGGENFSYNTKLLPKSGYAVIDYHRTAYGLVREIDLHGDGGLDRAMRVWQDSSVVIRNSNFYKVNYGFVVSENAQLTAIGTEGMATSHGWYVNFGGQIFGEGTKRPQGRQGSHRLLNGARDFTRYSSNVSTPSTPARQTVPKTKTKRWTTSSARVFYRSRPNYFTITFMRDFPIQGNWGDGWGFRDGAWYFGTGMRNELRGKNIKRIRVSIGRSAHNSQGYTGKRTFSLRLHNRSTKPEASNNTNPTFSSQVYRGSLAMGERKWFDVTSTFRTALSSGTWYGFGVKTDSTSVYEYMAMMKSITVEVTYE